MILRWLLLVAAALVVAGCAALDGPVAIWTDPQPDHACFGAVVAGILVDDPRSGLAFKSGDGGPNTPIQWPFGWSARRSWGDILLINERGKVVAHLGDRIVASGGHASDPRGEHVSDWVDCDVTVNPSIEP